MVTIRNAARKWTKLAIISLVVSGSAGNLLCRVESYWKAEAQKTLACKWHCFYMARDISLHSADQLFSAGRTEWLELGWMKIYYASLLWAKQF